MTKDHLRDVLDRFAQFFITPLHLASTLRSSAWRVRAKALARRIKADDSGVEKCKIGVFAS
jgi:hypothetical protein